MIYSVELDYIDLEDMIDADIEGSRKAHVVHVEMKGEKVKVIFEMI